MSVGGAVPPSSPLRIHLFQKYDKDLAHMALKHVSKCEIGHGSIDGKDNISPYPSVGQNIITGFNKDGVKAVNKWYYYEDQHYSYDTNTCDNGQNSCREYTQVSIDYG